MTEIEKMTQRMIIDQMTSELSKENKQEVLNDIEEIKDILKIEHVSIETIALLILLQKKKQ